MYRTPRQQSGRHGLKIRLLGGFRIEVSAQVVADSDWRLQKARALVKLLALAPRHRLTRDEAMERLWPELEPAAALNNLYYALHVARAALEGGVPVKSGGSSALQLAGGVITFSPSGSVCIDIETFQTAATAAWQSKDPIAYSKALNLYAGELLPEDRYEDWAARPREMLRDIQLRLLMDLAQIRQERGEYPEAIASLTQLMTEEPTHEEACASLMFLHAAAGQRWNAGYGAGSRGAAHDRGARRGSRRWTSGTERSYSAGGAETAAPSGLKSNMSNRTQRPCLRQLPTQWRGSTLCSTPKASMAGER